MESAYQENQGLTDFAAGLGTIEICKFRLLLFPDSYRRLKSRASCAFYCEHVHKTLLNVGLLEAEIKGNFGFGLPLSVTVLRLIFKDDVVTPFDDVAARKDGDVFEIGEHPD